MPDQDFGKDPSGITVRRGKLVLPLAVAGTIISSVVWGVWTVSRAFAVSEQASNRTTEQLRDMKDSQQRIESKVNGLDVRLIRVESKLEDEPVRRRRP